MRDLFWLIIASLLLGGGACTSTDLAAPALLETDARTGYERALRRNHGDFVADRFRQTARRALADSITIALPYEEKARVDSFAMHAATYTVALDYGQSLYAEWGSASTPLLVELLPAGENRVLYRSDWADTSALLPVARTGEYRLRVQPRWRTGGSYHLRLSRRATVGFPVAGKGNADVWSKWGDPRDGGKRKHEGIDIFAKRGTPAVAVTDGRVRLRNGGLGGKTVWLRDGEGRNWYYAHLDSQYVATGDRVLAGDTLGAVGNTGNARRTRPHLHFGLYRAGRGATDPFPFVRHYPTRFPNLIAEVERTNQRARTNRATYLLTTPDRQADKKVRIDGNSSVRLLGATGSYYRVRTPDGQVGYLSRTAIRRGA